MMSLLKVNIVYKTARGLPLGVSMYMYIKSMDDESELI